MADESDAADDLLFLALFFAGAYVFVRMWRNRLADAAGFGFQPVAPPYQNAFEQTLEILVPLAVSSQGAAYIRDQEGFRANPYADGKGKTSIGYGHQIQPGETIIPPITQAEALQIFQADLARVSAAVAAALKVEVTQSQFDALADFAFNEGIGAFQRSTLLQRLNGGDYGGAAGEFGRWVYSGGAVNETLVQRRAAEAAAFS